MLVAIHPKLPMRNKIITKQFYKDQLGFIEIGNIDYEGYLMLKKDAIEIHFFEFKNLNPYENDGQVYIRTTNIDQEFQQLLLKKCIHPNGSLAVKPWGQKEFSVLDPDHNLLTFGEAV